MKASLPRERDPRPDPADSDDDSEVDHKQDQAEYTEPEIRKDGVTQAALAALCDRLEEVIATRLRPLSIVDAICETGENPKMLRFAFEQLVAAERASFVGGAHRGWNLVRKARR